MLQQVTCTLKDPHQVPGEKSGRKSLPPSESAEICQITRAGLMLLTHLSPQGCLFVCQHGEILLSPEHVNSHICTQGKGRGRAWPPVPPPGRAWPPVLTQQCMGQEISTALLLGPRTVPPPLARGCYSKGATRQQDVALPWLWAGTVVTSLGRRTPLQLLLGVGSRGTPA